MIIKNLLFCIWTEESYFKLGIAKCSNLEIRIFAKRKFQNRETRFENLKIFPIKKSIFPGCVKSAPVNGKCQISFEIQKYIRIQNPVSCLRWNVLQK